MQSDRIVRIVKHFLQRHPQLWPPRTMHVYTCRYQLYKQNV